MRTLSYGAVLWDLFGDEERIGGAPFNVAAHLARLGAKSAMVTRIGRDRLGEKALLEMERLGVSRQLVQTDSVHPTGWAKVTVDGHGNATYCFPASPAYEHIAIDDAAMVALRADPADAICFGTLEQKGPATRRTLMRLLENVPFKTVLYDINIRLEFCPTEVVRASLAHTNVFKLNDEEAPLVAECLYGEALSERDLADRLFADFPVQVMCVTRGAEGCSVYAGRDVFNVSGVQVDVVDTVGAGDAFAAAFLKHWLETGDPVESGRRGNELGAWVASRSGAVPEEA
jgi:fructokinase